MSGPGKLSRKWFIALAIAIWATVVAAGALVLFVGVGYCYIGDPLLKNAFVCEILWRGTGAYDFITLVVGIPLLILVDHLARNPLTLRKFDQNRLVAFVAVAFLLLVYWFFFCWLIL